MGNARGIEPTIPSGRPGGRSRRLAVHLHGLGHAASAARGHQRLPRDARHRHLGDVWIQERVGIRSRRTTLPLEYIRATRNRDPRGAQEATLYTHAEAGRRAAEMALARAGIAPADVGMVIAGSSVMDTATPAEACNIARALGVEAPAFDVNSACTSFFAQLHVLSLMRPEALPPWVLLVVSEAVTRAVDYSDRSSAVLWGDGSVAAVLSTQVPGARASSRRASRRAPRAPTASSCRAPGTSGRPGASCRCSRSEKRGSFSVSSAPSTRRKADASTSSGTRRTSACWRRCAASARCVTTATTPTSSVRQHGGRRRAFGSVDALGRWTDEDDVAVVGVGAGLTWASYLLRFEGPAQ